MALIKCPECQTAVSDLADKCPKCGLPFPSYDGLRIRRILIFTFVIVYSITLIFNLIFSTKSYQFIIIITNFLTLIISVYLAYGNRLLSSQISIAIGTVHIFIKFINLNNSISGFRETFYYFSPGIILILLGFTFLGLREKDDM
jgi:hypothetical protein